MPTKDLVFTVLGIDRASNTFDKVGASMDRMAKGGVRTMSLLAGASVASSAAIAGALAALPLAFAAVGAAALKENDAVGDSFRNLGETVRTGLAEDAAPLESAYVGAAEEIARAYNDLRPAMRQAFGAVHDDVAVLTKGVTNFARNAMPGFLVAVESADPVMESLADLLGDTGKTTTEFFRIIATGAPEAAQGVQHFGDLIDGVLPDVGHLLVDLNSLWAEHGEQVARIADKLTDVFVDMGGSALPMVSNSLGLALDVLEGILSIVGPLSDELGTLIGIWITLSTAMRGIGLARAAVDSVTSSVANFRQEAESAGGTKGAGRLATGVGGVMGILGGPWGIAVLGATAALAAFGQESQQNAATQRTLAAALRASGGEFDAQAVQVFANTDAYKKISDDVEKAGLSQGQFIDALRDGGPELDALRSRLEDIHRSNTDLTVTGQGVVATENEQAAAARVLLSSLDSLRGSVTGATDEWRRGQDAIAGTNKSMLEALPGAASLREAMATLKDETADTADRADALNAAWRRLFGIGIELDEAVAEFEGGLDDIRSSIEEVKESTTGWQAELLNANGSINLTTEAGRRLHQQIVEEGEAYRTLAQTAYDTARQQGKSQDEATAAATAAINERRAQFIAEMVQLGLNQQAVERLTNELFGMPHEVRSDVIVETYKAQTAVNQFIRDNTGRVIGIEVRTQYSSVYGSAIKPLGGGNAFLAEGGPAHAGRSYVVGEEGPEIFTPGLSGMVTSTAQSSAILRNLTQPRALGPVPGLAATGHAEYHLHVHGPIGSQTELENWFVRTRDNLSRSGRD